MTDMIEGWSRLEAIKDMFGRERKLDIYAAIGQYSIDPPESFTSVEIFSTLTDETTNKSLYLQVWNEIQVLERFGMIERAERTTKPLIYTRVESKGWGIVAASVEAFNEWFPSPDKAK
jgi:hypothetical protein